MSYNIGVDLGGTNIRVGATNNDSELIYVDSVRNSHAEMITLMAELVGMIKQVPCYNQTNSIGLSIAGSVDKTGERVITSKNINGLVNYPITAMLRKVFNVPVYMENDAKVAAYGEALEGIGKDYKTVCYITISTGLGGGLVIDKKIYRGSDNFGSYIPRMYLDGYNTADNLISGRVLLANAKEKIDNDINSNKELFDLYKEGNKIAIDIIDNFKHYLKILLLNISATFNPDIIILGGGVVKSKDAFLKDVLTDYYKEVHPLAKNTIVTTQSLEEPGLVGASLLHKERIK